MTGEFERIERYLRPLTAACPGALALTDDAAVLEVPADMQLVVTTDAMVAGVHFLPDDPPADIAAKLLRTNLSDLAAMGADPFGYSLVLSLPHELGDDWLAAFTDGLGADGTRFGIPLIGGDSVSTRGPVTLAISMLGLVPRGLALTRRAAEPVAEQAVFVTGTIGDAWLGLKSVLGELELTKESAITAIARLRRPEPRLTVGVALRGIAGAAIDVSDGLIADLGHICEVSGCAASLQANRVPLSPSARTVLTARPDLLPGLLTGGDDYELVFTATTRQRNEVAAIAARLGVPITEIGRLQPGPPGQVDVLDAAGHPLPLLQRGWNHFPTRPL
ncbi:MAG: thiamine-phosphate kinase [Rhodospirillaceae bacterium]